MNQTKLSTTKTPIFFIKPKLAALMLFCFLGILNLSATWAQVSPCPEGDPLQWDWVQDLIDLGNELNGCYVNSIQQFQYNGSTHIKTNPGYYFTNDITCPADLSWYYYNCEGAVVCETGAFAVTPPERLCDADINAAANNATTIWIYNDSVPNETCPEGDPLQWDWVQELIDQGSKCRIGTIKQFDYNESTYFRVGEGPYCNVSDISTYYYNCIGDTTCVEAMLRVTCEEEFRLASKDAFTIWTYEPNETSDNAVFQEYPWLSTRVNLGNCYGESITVYDTGFYNFILIQNGNEGKLYFEDGTYYCDETPTYSCVAAYGLTNVVQTWSCSNTTSVSGCTDANAINYNSFANVDDGSCQYENAPVFSTYPWLSTYVNQSNCAGESITVYDAGYYNFILIENGNEGKLYLENGTYYCDETPTYSCVAAYGLTNGTQSWTCSNNTSVSGCTDVNAINYNANANVDDGSCQYENNNAQVFATFPWLSTYVNEGNCNGESITVYDTGYYNFILIQNGNEGKLYFDDGTYYCDETPSYSCVAAYGLTNVAQTWMCSNTSISGCTDMNAINYNVSATVDDGSCEYENNNNAQVFASFPWLSTYVNQNNCGGESITVYDTGFYNFILIENGNGGKLYFENGTYYCDETPTYSCVAAYGLTNVVDSWSCGIAGIEADRFYTICAGEEAVFYGPKPKCICDPFSNVLDMGLVSTSYQVYIDGSFVENVVNPVGGYIVSPEVNTTYTLVANPAPTAVGCACEYPSIDVYVAIDDNCGGNQTYKHSEFNALNLSKTTSFNMYPNPTTNKVFIDLPDEAIYQINLMNISGKVMKQLEAEPDATTAEIEVSDLPKGMYLVELKNEACRSIKKLIIE